MIPQRGSSGLRYLLLPFIVALVAAVNLAQNLPDLIENIRPSVVYIATFDAAGKPIMRGTGFALESNRVITNYHVISGASLSDGIVSALRSHPKFGKLIQITAPISAGSSGSPVVNLDGEVVGLVTMDIEGGQNLNFAIASEQLLSFWSPAAGAPRKGLPGTSTAKRWRLLDTNMSYDTETFSKAAGIASSWIRYDKPDGTYSKVLMEVNCNTSRIREVRSLSYRNTTEPPSESIGKGDWSPLVPESKGEVAFEVFCKEKNDYQSSVDYSRYSELYRQGLGFQSSQKLDNAIESYSQIIKELPDYAAWAYNAIAAIKLGQGKTGEARSRAQSCQFGTKRPRLPCHSWRCLQEGREYCDGYRDLLEISETN
ncbi:MAG: serine protease [Chloracidobacterium sp.]|nr:serine protease [Chloracidobacterium sp.]